MLTINEARDRVQDLAHRFSNYVEDRAENNTGIAATATYLDNYVLTFVAFPTQPITSVTIYSRDPFERVAEIAALDLDVIESFIRTITGVSEYQADFFQALGDSARLVAESARYGEEDED